MTGGLDTTEALIELLLEKKVISNTEAQSFLDRHRQKAKATRQVITILPQENQEAYLKSLSKGVTDQVTKDLNELKENYEFRSQDLMQKNRLLKREIEQLEEIVTLENKPALQKSSWAQRIRFGGDIRIRHESVLFDKDNATDIEDPNSPGTVINSTQDSHHQKIRLRVGLKADIIDQTDVNVGKVEAGIRLATGSVSNPVSTNYTLGHNTQSRSDIVLDRAYVKWTYKPEEEIWGGKIPQVSVTGGIMENPWLASNLIWDDDLAFEGLAVNFKTDTNEMNPLNGFLTLGYFPLEESEWSQSDKYLLGGQIGIDHRPVYGWKYSLAAAYYNYYNVSGSPIRSVNRSLDDNRALARMAPKSMQKGNTTFDMDQTTNPNGTTYGLLSDFELLNITGKLDNYLFFPIHVMLYGDWVKNLGYDSDSMVAKTIGSSKAYIESISGDIGYQIGLKVGYPKPRQRWDWNLFLEYRYLESDAVLDAFTDSDFHLGGTNSQGFILGGELGIYENIWVTAKWMSADEIQDMQSTTNSQYDDLAVDILQISINAEF
ncbi:MAG: putative porin [Pseudomonadota bacterium]